MRNAKEQHGEELGPKTPQEYADYFEIKSERPTFGETNKTGRKNAGHDKSWDGASRNVSPQGDGNPGPVTPISGGVDGNSPDPKTRSQYKYALGGRKYSAELGRVPDEGKKFEVLHTPGDGKMFVNSGPQTAANKREIKIGWKNRGYDLGENTYAGAPATAPNTPQRKRLRKTESGA